MVLVSVPLISPDPLAAIPVTLPTLSLVQLYTVPATLPLSTIVVIGTPEHFVCDDGVATAFGVGLTVIVNVFGVPVQDSSVVIKFPMAAGNTPTGIVVVILLVAIFTTDTLFTNTFPT